jgi:hypothetical protein
MDQPTLLPLMDRLRSLLERTHAVADRETLITTMDLIGNVVDRDEFACAVSLVERAIKKAWAESGKVALHEEAHALAVSAISTLKALTS